jgi:hypothetical protein
VTNTKNLERQLARVLAHPSTFPSFVSATRTEFARMAAYLARRWTPPAWVAPEDMIQELYYGAWIALFGKKPFDPTRGKTLAQYVVYNAMSRAKRALHKARGAKLCGSPDRNPSRMEIPFSAAGLGTFADTTFVESLLGASDAPTAERIMIMEESREEAVAKAMLACNTADQRVAIIALSEGRDVDAAGRLLYDDFETRIALRLGSEERAVHYIMREASAVASNLDAALAS